MRVERHSAFYWPALLGTTEACSLQGCVATHRIIVPDQSVSATVHLLRLRLKVQHSNWSRVSGTGGGAVGILYIIMEYGNNVMFC